MRGKYSNRSEAATVREAAISELEASRKALAAMSKEMAAVKATLASERQAWTEKAGKYEAFMREGTSDEVVHLQAQITAMREKEGTLKRNIGLHFARLLREGDMRASRETWDGIWEVLGLSPADVSYDEARDNRGYRRRRSHQIRSIRDDARQAKAAPWRYE